jgi:hypothetical protein
MMEAQHGEFAELEFRALTDNYHPPNLIYDRDRFIKKRGGINACAALYASPGAFASNLVRKTYFVLNYATI